MEQEIADLQRYKARLEERLLADTSHEPNHSSDSPDESISPDSVQKMMQLRSEKVRDMCIRFKRGSLECAFVTHLLS